MPTKTINDLTATADILDADELAFWNVANARTDKITYAELKTDLFGGLSGDTEILFNNAGNIDGDPRLLYNPSTNLMSLGGDFNMQITGGAAILNITPTGTIPNIIMNKTDPNTGIGWNSTGHGRLIGNGIATFAFGAGNQNTLLRALDCNNNSITSVSTLASFVGGRFFFSTTAGIGGTSFALRQSIAPVPASPVDSPDFILTSRYDDGASDKDTDWKHFVNATDDAGASLYKIQTQINGAGYTDIITFAPSLITSAVDFKIANGQLLELGSKVDPDPTGTAGDMYYNTTSNTFRGFTTAWGNLGGNPGGSDTQIQYNNGGVFGGTSVLTFNDTTNLLTYTPLLDEATGDEIGLHINMTVNKATSGDYAAIQVDVTETAAPGSFNRLLRLRVASGDVFTVSDLGNVSLDGNISSIGTAISIGNSGTLTRMSVQNLGTGDPYYQLAISTTRAYAIGIDNTDDDTLKITTDAAGAVNPSTGTTIMSFGAGPNIGFFGAAAAAKPTVTGSRDGNAALADLLIELATLGLLTDSSSA